MSVAVVGGGPAGIELAFGIRARWGARLQSAGRSLAVVVLDGAEKLLPHESDACRAAVDRALAERGIEARLHTSSS